MHNLDNLDKIKSYFSRGDKERSTPVSKRRRRQEPGHGDDDHGGTINNQILFPLKENKPVENNYNNYNVFHSARNNSMAQGPKSGSLIKGSVDDILHHYYKKVDPL